MNIEVNFNINYSALIIRYYESKGPNIPIKNSQSADGMGDRMQRDPVPFCI